MKADFRLFRQGGGRSAFAHVFVEGVPHTPSEYVATAVLDPSRMDDGANPVRDPELVLAAVAGCKAALKWRRPVEGWTVTIVHIGINLVDTTAEVVAVSACLATLKLVHGDIRFEPRWMGRHWGVWDPARRDILPVGELLSSPQEAS
jgi:hypothetical protein